MLWLRFAMIQSDPPITRNTIRTPNASASTLLVLLGPVVMCRKNTRCTPICAIASTTSATGMLGSHTRLVPATKKEVAVSRMASPQAVAPHQREERREERAARRTGAAHHQAGKFVAFNREKPEDENAGEGHGKLKPDRIARIGCDRGQTAGKARGEQEAGFDRHVVQVEQLASARPARRLPEQDRVGSEEGREHHHVAKDENPEAVAGDDALGRRPAVRERSF